MFTNHRHLRPTHRHRGRLSVAIAALIGVLAVVPTAAASASASAPQGDSSARLGPPWDVPAIVGGDLVERPPEFMASLQRFDQPWFEEKGWAHACGAMVIHPRWALSAAHCVQPLEPGEDVRLRLRIRSSRWDRGGQIVQVARVVQHPEVATRSTADLVLLELKRPVDVTPVRIGRPTGSLPTRVVAMGWGVTEPAMVDTETVDLPPRRLRSLPMNIVDARRCDLSDEYTLCVAPVRPKTGTCNFDSGGPLLHRNGAGWTLLGSLFGEGNAFAPGSEVSATRCRDMSLFGNVTLERDWIEETIGAPLP